MRCSSSSGVMAMASEESTCSKMAKLRMSCEEEIRLCREKYGRLASSIRESIKSIKPLIQSAQTNRGKLAELKEHLKELEAIFRETLKANASKEARHASISETISATVVRIEHLRKIIDEQKAKKNDHEAVLSQQVLALQKIEEKNEEDSIEIKNIKEATDWYKNVLGFQIEGGEGVKFIFNKIDMNDPDKEYSFVVRLDGDIYTLLRCNPHLDDLDELVEELNRTNGLFKFVRFLRKKFEEISRKESHSSSSPRNSMDSRIKMHIEDNLSSQYKMHPSVSLPKGVRTHASILSPESVSTFRRSQRLMVKKPSTENA